MRQVLQNGGLDDSQMRSSLDLVMKALGNVPEPDRDLLQALPSVYRLRNRVIHGAHSPSPDEVAEVLPVLAKASTAMAEVTHQVLQAAFVANTLGRRGIRSVESVKPPEPGPRPTKTLAVDERRCGNGCGSAASLREKVYSGPTTATLGSARSGSRRSGGGRGRL